MNATFKSVYLVLLIACTVTVPHVVAATPTGQKKVVRAAVDHFTVVDDAAPSLAPAEQCSSKFTPYRHLQCGPAALKFLAFRASSNDPVTYKPITGSGLIRIAFSVKWGHVHYTITGVDGTKLMRVVIDIPTASGQVNVVFPTPKHTVSGRFPTPIADFEVKAMRDNCCGHGAARALVTVNACTKNGPCGFGYAKAVGLRFRCAPTCDKESVLVVGVPMSETRKCPGCVRA